MNINKSAMAIAVFFHIFIANFQCELNPGGQTNKFLKKMVGKVEKVETYRTLVDIVETYLNWVEPIRTLFLGRENQNIAKFGRES